MDQNGIHEEYLNITLLSSKHYREPWHSEYYYQSTSRTPHQNLLSWVRRTQWLTMSKTFAKSVSKKLIFSSSILLYPKSRKSPKASGSLKIVFKGFFRSTNTVLNNYLEFIWLNINPIDYINNNYRKKTSKLFIYCWEKVRKKIHIITLLHYYSI